MRPPLQALVPDWLRAALASDPAYRVLTMDGTGWIDPYTAQVVPTPFGHDLVSKRHLMRTKPWEHLSVRPLSDLLTARWLHYLRAQLEFVPQLRVFAQGLWLNPYTGQWVPGVILDAQGRVNLRTIESMAQQLALCREAQIGRMLERAQLDALSTQGPTAPRRQVFSAPAMARPEAASKSAVSNKLIRTPDARKTDFHHIKQGLVKMLTRPPKLDGFQLVLHYEPNAAISRDFYDLIPLSKNRLLLALGSIEGNGPGLALFPAISLKSLRAVADSTPSLIELAVRLQDAVRPDLHQDCAIPLFLAMLDQERRTITCLSAGHQPALLLNPNREATLTRIGTPGVALGRANADGLRRQLRPLTLSLDRGDILLMHSDGLARAANAKREAYGAYRLLGTCVAHLGQPVKDLVAGVTADVRAHTGTRLIDDLTLIALRSKDPEESAASDSLGQTWLGRISE